MNLSAGTGVPVFATTVTRDAGFGGAGEKVLAEGQLCYLSSTNVVQYYDGAAWATVGPITQQTAVFNETQASGTLGGASVTSWTKRTLNTTAYNDISGCSIASSVITVGAGTYNIWAIAPAYESAEFKIKLRNTTAGSDAIIGSSERCGTASQSQTISTLQGRVTPTGDTNYELQMNVTNARATVGFGFASSLSVNEIYSQIKIEKVA
jgi:hypothetical protein